MFKSSYKPNVVVANSENNSHNYTQTRIKYDTQLNKRPISTFKQVIEHLESQINKEKRKEKG